MSAAEERAKNIAREADAARAALANVENAYDIDPSEKNCKALDAARQG